MFFSGSLNKSIWYLLVSVKHTQIKISFKTGKIIQYLTSPSVKCRKNLSFTFPISSFFVFLHLLKIRKWSKYIFFKFHFLQHYFQPHSLINSGKICKQELWLKLIIAVGITKTAKPSTGLLYNYLKCTFVKMYSIRIFSGWKHRKQYLSIDIVMSSEGR